MKVGEIIKCETSNKVKDRNRTQKDLVKESETVKYETWKKVKIKK